jgi:hypothetical protein
MKTWHIVLIAAATVWGLNALGFSNPLSGFFGSKSS